ncbi:MAG TPA: ribosome silencing factor [Thermoleophilaceae bacterium]|nr:ribosome silencing factor [Thermoleophilaceae bacterium]
MTERPGPGARAAADEEPGSGATAPLSPAALAERIARIASERKAIDVRLLDLRGVVSYTDYLVICSGNTDRQTRAIHEAIHKELKDSAGLLPRRVEGEREARWILLDYLDCVAHVFTPDARSYYRLEQLWGEVPSRAVE